MKKIPLYALMLTAAGVLAFTNPAAEAKGTKQSQTHGDKDRHKSEKSMEHRERKDKMSSVWQIPLTDEEIAQVLITANRGEVRQSRIAAREADDEAVRSFAQTMVDEHTRNTEMLRDVMKRNDIRAKQSETSRNLKKEASEMTSDLKKADDREFERLYSQIAHDMHQNLLEMIDTQLLPQARNPELRAHLQQTRSRVSTHLAHAHRLTAQTERTAGFDPDFDTRETE